MKKESWIKKEISLDKKYKSKKQINSDKLQINKGKKYKLLINLRMVYFC